MLTLTELKTRAPAALTKTPAAHCSPKYVMLPTISAIEALQEEGYSLVAAKQDSVAGDSRWHSAQHARHMVRLRMETGSKLKLPGVLPEIVITNSANGSCPFEMWLGMLRLVCSNGLIAWTKSDGASFVHRHITVDDVIARARALSANSKPLFDKIRAWSRLELTEKQVLAFAREAVALRIGEDRAKLYDPASIVAVRRPEDEAPTLWNVFNRAQENGMTGAIVGRGLSADPERPGRTLTGRPLTGVGAELKFNTEIWALMERFAAKVAA